MGARVKMTPEEAWRNLRENGPKHLVDLSSNDLINDKPSWFDEQKFARGRKAVLKYYLGVSFSSYTGLLLILQLPDGLEPLLVTGNSKDIPALYKRYLSTVLHVKSWYDDDIFDPNTKGYKSIRLVRSMHKRVQQLMNDRFKVNSVHDKPRLWMTQYEVAITQFAFIGLAMLYPEKSAMILAKPDEMEAINYYWRVLGWFMGMRDEFNICLFDSYADIREYLQFVFKHEFLDKYKEQPCEKGLKMTQSISVALRHFTPLITFNVLAHWWSDCFTFNGYELQPLTMREKFLYYFNSISFKQLLKSETFLNSSTKLQRRMFDRRLKNRDKVYEKLTDKYKNCAQFTYYSDRVDYFAKTTPDDDDEAKSKQQETNNNNQEDKTIQVCELDTENNNAQKTLFESSCPFAFDTTLPNLRTENAAA